MKRPMSWTNRMPPLAPPASVAWVPAEWAEGILQASGAKIAHGGREVSGEHPIMDGQKHRITVEGEKHSEHSGSGIYVAHLDGHPAGHIKNNKTGEAMDWKYKGYVLDPAQKARLQAEAATRLQGRQAAQAQQHEAAASRVALQMAKLLPMAEPTPYLVSTG